MKTTKDVLTLILLIIGTGVLVHLTRDESVLKKLLWISFIILLLFLLNNYLSHKWRYRKYFLSPWNLLTTKHCESRDIDIESSLMIKKLEEIIESIPGFKLSEKDNQNRWMVIKTKPSWQSWGETIYIELIPGKDGTELRICSVTVFGIHEWGKNKKKH